MAQDTPPPIGELQKKPKTDHSPMAERIAESIISLKEPDEIFDVLQSINILVSRKCEKYLQEMFNRSEELYRMREDLIKDINKYNDFINKLPESK